MSAFLPSLPAWLYALLAIGGTEAVHAALNHRTELAAIGVGVAGWLTRRARRRFRHTGQRVMSAEAQAAAKAARKARAAAQGRHEHAPALETAA